MSILKKLASETALYGVSSILGRLINYALVPLHTSVFVRPGEQAVLISLFAFVAVLNVIYTYGMETAYFRFASREKDKAVHYYNLVQTAIIITSCVFSGVLILLDTPIMNALNYEGQELYLDWFAIIVAIDAIVSIPFARLRLEKKPKAFVKARVSNILINVGLNFFFLWFCKHIYQGDFLLFLQPVIELIFDPHYLVGYVILANLIANALFFWLLWGVLRDFQFTFDTAQFKLLFNYAYPILIMSLAGTVNLMTDRLFLDKLLPIGFYEGRTAKDVLGIYGNCYKLSIFMALAVQAFRYAAEPFFFSKANDRNAPSVFADVMKWFIIVSVLIWLGVCLNADWISKLFLRRAIYREGIRVVPVLLLGNLFLGIYYNLSVWFKLSDKTYFGTLITIVGAVINVALNYVLIPIMGYMGCALALVTSCFAMVALCYYWGEKHYPIPYYLRSAIGYIVSGGILIWISWQIHISNSWVSISYHNFLLMLYVIGIIVVERRFLPKTIQQKLRFLK
jgi:O-antigen/teichoic acid export membrane protein